LNQVINNVGHELNLRHLRSTECPHTKRLPRCTLSARFSHQIRRHLLYIQDIDKRIVG
jgi:hypothetical protein